MDLEGLIQNGLVPILSEVRSVFNLTPYFLKTHFNIILSLILCSSKRALPF
jgi:hypothetical protein